jgi:hypothetical protein
VNPPFSLDGLPIEDLNVVLAVDVDELRTDCPCTDRMELPAPKPWDTDPDCPDHVPEDPDIREPTIISGHDKWDLMQCKTCGAIWWRHNVQADYGDPRL